MSGEGSLMIAAANRWLMAPAPPTRLASLRIFIGAYAHVFVISRFFHLWQTVDLPQRQFEPVGVLGWLTVPLPGGLVRALIVVAIPLGIAFVTGTWYRFTGPAFALVFLFVSTYRLSWGHVIHSEHLPALHLLVVGLAPAADAWAVGARQTAQAEPSPRYGWPIRIMAVEQRPPE